MIVAEIRTDALIWLEAAIWSPHLDTWRLERVIAGERQLPMVDTTFVGAVSQTEDAEVPFENVLLLGHGDKVRQVCPFEQVLKLGL